MLWLFFLLLSIYRSLSWPDWKGENVKWAEHCDYSGNDLYNKPSTGEQCGGICEAEPRCTNFVWTDYNAGTCWLKSGSNLAPIGYDSGYSVCGYIQGRGGGGGGGRSLKKTYEGATFFDGFDFWTYDDPTHGYVDYVDRGTAERNGWASVQNEKVFITPDHQNGVPDNKRGRPSVRIHSKDTYNSGLFIFDLDHMPTGPGTWPAYWFVGGGQWPANGEVDVLEGVGGMKANNMAMHTSNGCKMDEWDRNSFSGQWSPGPSGNPATNCYVNEPNQYPNQGCSIHTSDGFYGEELNNAGGGVFAYEWDRNSHMKIWIFRRNDVPNDIRQGNPNPSSWAKPMAYFKLGGNCPANHFNDMRIIINLTFCGDWAGSVYPGGMEACKQKVKNDPGAYKDAYWQINYIKVFA